MVSKKEDRVNPLRAVECGCIICCMFRVFVRSTVRVRVSGDHDASEELVSHVSLYKYGSSSVQESEAALQYFKETAHYFFENTVS